MQMEGKSKSYKTKEFPKFLHFECAHREKICKFCNNCEELYSLNHLFNKEKG